MARLGAKVSQSEVLSIPKNTFSFWIFVLNLTSPILLAKRTRWCDWGQKCPRAKFRPSQKTRFRFEFLYSIAPHQFCWPNGLDGAIEGKSVPERSFIDLKKHVFGFNFSTKSHLTYFHGQTDWMARLGAKVSRSEVSSFPKNTFSFRIFWWNRPHTIFLSLIGYMVRSWAKLFRTKTLLNFASKALSYSFFQKTRFCFEIL